MREQLDDELTVARKARWVVTGMVAAWLAALGIFVGVSGCKSTPSRFEARFYDINTNLLPRVVWVTNLVLAGSGEQGAGSFGQGIGSGERGAGSRAESAGRKAESAGLREQGAAAFAELRRARGGAGLKGGVHGTDRSVVPAGGQLLPLQSPAYETNVTMVTNYEEAYTYTPNERARSLSAVAGTAAGLLGPVGELVALLCAGVFGVWAQIRTTKATKVAGVLAQVIETGRAVLQASPQGQKLDEKWKSWMITHQAQQGVIEDVVKLLATVVDDGTAKDAAARLLALMKGERP